MKRDTHHLSKSAMVEQIPAACTDELAAVEFLEAQRWGAKPTCVHSGSSNVYKMTDAQTGKRNARFLWRCHDCKKQYTVRVGTVYEESRILLKHWCYAFWRAATSKKGVAALEIMRQCQISYKSALFMMTRIRFAMSPDINTDPKLAGVVEVDETYVGGKPRYKFTSKHGRGTSKTPVFVAVERQGRIHRRVITDVTASNLKSAMYEVIDRRARIMSDDFRLYWGVGKMFLTHETVNHSEKEYARGEVHVNTAESSFALLKRGITGIYHNVSKQYLQRYIWQADFLWNNRKLNDGERVIAAIRSAEGKRVRYLPEQE